MTPTFDYSGTDIERVLGDVGIGAGDVVFVQSSLGMLGRPDGVSNINEACALLHRALRDVVGDNGTIVIPTYTYSFCDGKPFSPAETPSTIGPFSEYFRVLPDARRSVDPIFSVAADGPHTDQIINDLPHDCFGPGSVYDRLCDLGAKIVTVGLGMEYATFRHHAEQMAEIPPRFLKAFSGIVHDADATRSETWLYYVPALIENCDAAGRTVAEAAREQGVARCADLGRNQVWTVDASGYRQFLIDALADDPWCTSRGPAVDVISAERSRADVCVSGSFGNATAIVSEDARRAVGEIAESLGFEMQEWRTGTRFGDWVVPENWQLRAASVIVDGDRTFDAGQDFSVSAYSAKVSGTMTGSDFMAHLNRPVAGNMDWALRDITDDLLEVLDTADVQVEIDAAKSVDMLRVARSAKTVTGPLVMVCLTGDDDADLQLISDCPYTHIYVLPGPVAAIPVLYGSQMALGTLPDHILYAGQSEGWDEVRSILAADGRTIRFDAYHGNAHHNAKALEQEHA